VEEAGVIGKSVLLDEFLQAFCKEACSARSRDDAVAGRVVAVAPGGARGHKCAQRFGYAVVSGGRREALRSDPVVAARAL